MNTTSRCSYINYSSGTLEVASIHLVPFSSVRFTSSAMPLSSELYGIVVRLNVPVTRTSVHTAVLTYSFALSEWMIKGGVPKVVVVYCTGVVTASYTSLYFLSGMTKQNLVATSVNVSK